MDEFDVFIRQNLALRIIHKVKECATVFLSTRVSARKPFGIPTNYQPTEEGIPCWFIQRIGLKCAARDDVDDSRGYLSKWKLLVPKAPIAGQTDFTKPVGFYYDGNTRIAKPGECCTESWIVAGSFDTEAEALSYKTYIFTKTVRFLLLQTVVSQDVTKKNLCFVPDLEDMKVHIQIRCYARCGISLMTNGGISIHALAPLEVRTMNYNRIVPCNIKRFDVVAYFATHVKVVWRNSFTIQAGDSAYIYLSAPYGEILYKCIVLNDKVDDEVLQSNQYAVVHNSSSNFYSQKVKYMVLQLENVYPSGMLSLWQHRTKVEVEKQWQQVVKYEHEQANHA